MDIYNLNLIIYPLAILLAVVSFFTGFWMLFRSFFLLRGQITRSLNMDIDVVKVSKPIKSPNPQAQQQPPKNDKELISVMEQLLASLGNIKEKAGIFHRIIYGDAIVAFEIANPSNTDEISFYVGAPKKFINIVERQIHSFYPKASIERVKDYNIFHPGSFTAASYLKLRDKNYLPIRTYQTLESDPLNNIMNVLGKLDEKKEGAAIQVLVKPARGNWRTKGRQVASKMQQGRRLEEGKWETPARKFVRGFFTVIFKKGEDRQKDIFKPNKDPIQLTPDEQEVVKKIEGKANKPGFRVNVRLVASGLTQEKTGGFLGGLGKRFI